MSQPSSLMHEWIRIGHRFRHIRWPRLIEGMSKSDFFVMSMIFHHRMRHPEIPGIYASTIAAHARVSRPAVSRQLQQLEERGWITRRTDPNSKRNVFIDLTDEGMTTVQQQHEYGEQFLDRVFPRVGEQRMAEAIQTLYALADAMEAEIENVSGSAQETHEKGECK